MVDEEFPEVSDVDLLSIWEQPEEMPERLVVDEGGKRVFVDVLWVPASKMFDHLEAATYKILPHLLLESEAIWTRSESVASLVENIRRAAFERPLWSAG